MTLAYNKASSPQLKKYHIKFDPQQVNITPPVVDYDEFGKPLRGKYADNALQEWKAKLFKYDESDRISFSKPNPPRKPMAPWLKTIKQNFLYVLYGSANQLKMKPKIADDAFFSIIGEEAKRCANRVRAKHTLDQQPRIKKQPAKNDRLWYIVPYALAMKKGDPDRKQQAKLLQQLKKHRFLYCYNNLDGETFYFESNQKGTQRYNKKMYFDILDTAQCITADNREVVALTITCDTSQCNGNRFYLWRDYTDAIREVMDYQRKHKKALYIWIKESTANGYPHAHIIISYPKGTIKGYSSMKNHQEIKYGDFIKTIKTRLISPIFHCEKCEGPKLVYYVTKYIAKGTTSDLLKFADPSITPTPEEDKMLKCLLATISTKTRQYGKSTAKEIMKTIKNPPEQALQNLTAKMKDKKTVNDPPLAELEYDAKLLKDLCRFYNGDPEDPNRAEAGKRLRRHLMRLCNNSPVNCCFNLYSIPLEHYEKLKMPPPNEIDRDDEVFFKKFKSKAHNIACSGCIFSELRKLFEYGYTPKFDVIFVDKNGNSERLFTPEVCADDAKWLDNVAKLFQFLWQYVIVDKQDWRLIHKNSIIAHNPYIYAWLKSDENTPMVELAREANNYSDDDRVQEFLDFALYNQPYSKDLF